MRVREDAIVESVNRLLADKGFDLMTVDEAVSYTHLTLPTSDLV